jgi:hypothetical protein
MFGNERCIISKCCLHNSEEVYQERCSSTNCNSHYYSTHFDALHSVKELKNLRRVRTSVFSVRLYILHSKSLHTFQISFGTPTNGLLESSYEILENFHFMRAVHLRDTRSCNFHLQNRKYSLYVNVRQLIVTETFITLFYTSMFSLVS